MHSFQLNHGKPPIVDPGTSTMNMKLLIQQALNRRYIFHGWEAQALKTFIWCKWDHGALRTYWAYFHDDIEQGEACLFRYFCAYYDQNNGSWICFNPSSAAVYTIRKHCYELTKPSP
jgi:hypothetical protein